MARKRQDDTDQLARIDRHVGSRIREIRKARGLSTEALAEVVGISPGQFAKYEVAGTRVCVGNLYMVARHLGVPVTMFFPDAGKVGVAPAAHAVRLATLVDLFESIPDPHLKRALVATRPAAQQRGWPGQRGARDGGPRPRRAGRDSSARTAARTERHALRASSGLVSRVGCFRGRPGVRFYRGLHQRLERSLVEDLSSPMSIARRVPPPWPALNSPAGSGSAAPLGKVSFTRAL